jgi:hypothetical protein
MINHVRTLLLNLPAAGALPGEVMVDPSFSPLTLRGPLAELHGALSLSGCSREISCFKADGLMVVMHAPEFEAYVLRMDPRITYSVADFAYVSEAGPDAGWPPFNLTRMVAAFSAVLGRTGYNLFSYPEYDAEMQVLREVWFGSGILRDRTASGVLALAYNMDRTRRYGF